MVNNSGIGVYTRKYIDFLLADNTINVGLIGKENELVPYFGLPQRWHLIEADIPIYSVQEQVKLPLLIPACDLFWSPHYNIPLLPIKAKKRLVTIPDVFHLAHLGSLTIAQRMYAKLVTNAAAWQSDKILTISTFSEREIVRYTGIKEDKIKTIYLGLDRRLFRYIADEHIQQRVREQYQLPKRYILFVGNVKPNKNLRALINAFAKLAGTIPDVYLLIAGKKDGFITGDSTLFAQIEQNDVLKKRIVFSGYVANEDLPVLYSMASVFAFPSLYEGFGFPPLEAMACQCPVVASDRASIPEICGDAAFYVNPTNINDLADGIQRVLTDSSCRKQLVEAGIRKVHQYDWLHSQQQFMQEVQQLANER
jgi:glycosyltransferase involved in cell wall biosynthesis